MPTTSKYDRPIKAPWQPLDWGYLFAPRRTALPAPTAGIFDEPCYCLKINAAWVGHFVGVIQALLEDDAWMGDENASYAAQQEIERFLAQFGDDMGCKTIFRQNPTNTCQLQYSTDNGANWILAFDYGLCQSPADNILIENTYQEIFNTWNETTNNTQININAPTLTFISSPGDTADKINERTKALCYAAKVFVDTFCESVKIYNQANVVDPLGLVSGVLSVVTAVLALAAAAGVTFISAGTMTPVGIALAAAISGLAAQGFELATNEALDDAQARENVACCLFQAIANLEPTAANFEASVDNCPGFTGNSEIIRATLANALHFSPESLNDQFNSFINLLGEATKYAALDLVPDCPCETPAAPTWCVDVDFAQGLQGFSIANISGQNYGTLQSGVGIVGANINESGVYSKRVYVQRTGLDVRAITGVDAILDYTKGSFASGGQWALATNTNSDGAPDYTTPSRTATQMVTGNNQTIECDYPDLDRTAVLVDIRASRMTTTPPDGAITLKKLRIRGMGQKPSQFAALPDCGEFCWVWDFAASQNAQDWEQTWGTYSTGLNTQPDPVGQGGLFVSDARALALFGNLLTIREVAITFNLAKGTYPSGGVGCASIALWDANLNLISDTPLPQSSVANGNGLVYAVPYNQANVKRVSVLVRSAQSNTYNNVLANPGAGKITRVKIRYSGSEIWQNGEPC